MKNIEDYEFPRSHWEHLIDQWILGRNSQRDREILKRRLLDGLTFEKLAEEFDLSVQQVKHIVYKRIDKLSKHM